MILLLLKFCDKSLSKTSHLFRKQLIAGFSFNRQQFLHSFESTTLYFKETTLDDIKSCDKKRKKLTFRHITKTFIKSDSSATKCSNHSRVHFPILIFISSEKFWWKAKRKSFSRMVIKKLTATKGASSIALHTNLLCR